MANTTPESLVYRGREGSGAAQIFGQPGNPFKAFYNRKDDVFRKEQIQFERDKIAKQQRDRKMFEILDVEPERAFEPFEKQKTAIAQAHRDKVAQYFAHGGTPDDPQFLAWNKNQWDKVNTFARKSTFLEKQIGATMDMIKKNPFLKTDYYFPKIFDHYLDAEGNGKPLDDIDVNAIANITESDPMGFDFEKYTNDFLGNIKDNVYGWVEKRNTAYGVDTDDVQVKVKGSLFKTNHHTASGVDEDEHGNPVVNVSNELMNSLLASPNAKRFADKAASMIGMDPRQFTAQHVKDNLNARGGGFAKDVKPSNKMFPASFYNNTGSGIKPKDLPLATKRMQKISSIQNAFSDQDGNEMDHPSEEAIAAANDIAQNSKWGGADIIGYEFVKGTPKPGSTTIRNKAIENSADNRLVLFTKQGQRGRVTPYEINLSEPSGGGLNSIFETAKSEGGFKIPYDRLVTLDEENAKTGKRILDQHRGVSATNSRKAKAEQAQVDEWKNYKNLDRMAGKSLGGKKIASADADARTGWFGNRGIKITFEDGTTQLIKEDDYDSMAEIHQSKRDQKAEGSSFDYNSLK